MPPKKKQSTRQTIKNKNKSSLSREGTVQRKKSQRGGNGKCSSSGGVKMKKPDPDYVGAFKTGKDYQSLEKEINKSPLFPGLPPKPPMDKCVIL
jgi:hypothetical protein